MKFFSKMVCFILLRTILGFATQLEDELKDIPDAERPSIFINLANEQFEDLGAKFKKVCHSRELNTKKLEGQSRKEEEIGDIEYQKKFNEVCRSFKEFRNLLSDFAAFNYKGTLDENAISAQTYYETTKLFTDYAEANLLPKGFDPAGDEAKNVNKLCSCP